MPFEGRTGGANGAPGSEQSFFADPAIDRLTGVVFNLAAELQVLRDRLATAEMLLERRGVIGAGELDGFRPDAAQEAALAGESRAFVAELFEPLLGRPFSRSQGGPA